MPRLPVIARLAAGTGELDTWWERRTNLYRSMFRLPVKVKLPGWNNLDDHVLAAQD